MCFTSYGMLAWAERQPFHGGEERGILVVLRPEPVPMPAGRTDIYQLTCSCLLADLAVKAY